MRCRICSELVSGHGKICEDCEVELDHRRMAAAEVRATDAAVTVLSPSVPLIDTSRNASAPSHKLWGTTPKSRAIALAAGCSVAVASAAATYFEWRSIAFGAPPAPAAYVSRAGDAMSDELSSAEPFAPSTTRAAGTDSVSRSAAATPTRRQVLEPRHLAVGKGSPTEPKSITTSVGDRPTLAGALASCNSEFLLVRLACEQLARARYCERKTGQVPECPQTPIFTDRS
jgi:hypothetical protein